MFSIIALPSSFVTTTIGYMSDLFVDFAPIIAAIVGVLLSLLVISILIDAFKK